MPWDLKELPAEELRLLMLSLHQGACGRPNDARRAVVGRCKISQSDFGEAPI